MFIVTAKLSKKKALLIVLVLAILIGAIIMIAGRRDRGDSAHIEIESEADILAHLEHLGWQVEPNALEIQEILIPREFSDAFEAYNTIQQEAGFDLRDWRGKAAVRFTYRILNYPGQTEGVIVDVLVAENRIIGGDIQSIHADGFIHGLQPHRGA